MTLMRRLFARRLAVELGIFVTMCLGAANDPDLFSAITALVLIPIPIAQWGLFFYLHQKAKEAKRSGLYLQPLIDRVQDARTLALASTGGAVAGLFVVARQFDLLSAAPREWYLVIVAYVLVMLSVPTVSWLFTWRDVWGPMVRNREATNASRPTNEARFTEEE